MEYTKGEWKIHGASSGYLISAGTCCVAKVYDEENPEANAHLISAAPVMHGQLATGVNTLKKALLLIDAGQSPAARDYLCGVIAGNEIALAKAEGKQ